jgi:hypothetical protein
MIDGYLETNDIRDAIIDMIVDGPVLVGNVNTKDHTLRYVKIAYSTKVNGQLSLILEIDEFGPEVTSDGQEE